MIKFITLTLFFTLFSYKNSSAQVQNLELSHFSKKNSLQFINTQNAYSEIPPWILEGGWRTYSISTAWTAYLSTPLNIVDTNISSIDFTTNTIGPTFISSPLTWWNNYYVSQNLNTESLQFRRNYQGIFSAHKINHIEKGNVIIAISHGENKNEVISGYNFQNTVLPSAILNPNDPSSYSGYSNGVYNEDWDSYFAFVNAQWIKTEEVNNWGHQYHWELGPIAWPAYGYITANNQKASNGLRHPSSIIKNDSLYIYYVDSKLNSIPWELDREVGVKVSRVHINDALKPEKYTTYCNGQWLPSLPSNFNLQNLYSFLDQKGPASTNILNGDLGTGRFSVALVKDENFYLGIEAYNDYTDNKYKIALRKSTDLINWSRRFIVLQVSESWNESDLKYPIFVNETGWSNTKIDLCDFFIIGTEATNKISRYQTCLEWTDLEVVDPINPGPFSKFSVYPNPNNTNTLNIIGQNLDDASLQLKISDIYGNLIDIENFNLRSNKSAEIDISTLPKGYYILILNNEKSQKHISFSRK